MKNKSLPETLILASGSSYRKQLLKRLGIGFQCHSPDIDESPLAGEAPDQLVQRLARQKAAGISNRFPSSVVIGSDQVSVFDQRINGKPGDHATAVQQLSSFSGQIVEFFTAVTVLKFDTSFAQHHLDITRVHFRDLTADEIERYLRQEQPYDCAGAFKAESLGIVLFRKIESVDPTALIGLPLIKTAAMLRNAGLELP